MNKKTEKIDIFKYAAQKALRFPFRGNITVEDLFMLRMEDLDIIYKTLGSAYYKVVGDDCDSLIDTDKTNSEEAQRLKVSMDIVKEIFNDKKDAYEKAQKKLEKQQKMQKIMSIMAQKEDDALRSKSLEELQKELDVLSGDD